MCIVPPSPLVRVRWRQTRVGCPKTHALQRTEHRQQSQAPCLFWENPGPNKWSLALPGVRHTSPEAGAPRVCTPASPRYSPPARYWGDPCPTGAGRSSGPCHREASSRHFSVLQAPAALSFEPSYKENISQNKTRLSPCLPVTTRADLMTFSDTRPTRGLASRG